MMIDLEQIKQRHAAELARAQKELRIAELAPVCPNHVISGRRPILSYRDVEPAAALALFRAFSVIPGYFWRGAFLSWEPGGDTPPKSDSRAVTVAGPMACQIDLSGIADSPGGADLRLKFFGRLSDGTLCEVWAHIKGPGYLGSWPRYQPAAQDERDGRQRLVKRSYRKPPALCGLADFSASYSTGGGGPIASGWDFLFAFMAENDGEAPGGDNSHALAQLANVLEGGGAVLS